MSDFKVFTLALVEMVADSALKKYATSDESLYLVVGATAYVGVVTLLVQLLKSDKLGTLNVRWNTYSTVLNALAGHFILGEEYTTNELVGGGISIAGLQVMDSN